MYTDPIFDKNTDETVDAFFAGIDKTLEHVNEVLQNAQVNVDLSGARASVKNAGENVSRSVHKARRSPVPQGQSFLAALFSVVSRLFALLSGAKKHAPTQTVADEDLPFAEDNLPHEAELLIPLSGNETVDAVVAFQLSQIAFAEDCATQLFRPAPKVAMQIEDICRVHRCILYALARRPELLAKLQKFFGYYVPTFKKFCLAYMDLHRQTQAADAPNARKTMAELEEAFVSLEQAFRKKADSLYGVVELDISSDISVLDAMLRKDGLV